MIGINLKISIFFSWGIFSSLAFLCIFMVLRFPIRPMNFISSLSLSSFKVVDFTSQEGGRARMTFLTFWSLSISSPKEERPFVILVNFITISSMDSFLFKQKFSYWECKRSILALLTCDIPSWVTTKCVQIKYVILQWITLGYHQSKLVKVHSVLWY